MRAAVAKEAKVGARINTIMQTCFFAISGVLPREEAIGMIKESIKKTYGKRGEPVVRQNYAAVDSALAISMKSPFLIEQRALSISRPPSRKTHRSSSGR
jgi:Pyruvate/2-oxoacid:ferredoxin oxidoreductase gamma subunit